MCQSGPRLPLRALRAGLLVWAALALWAAPAWAGAANGGLRHARRDPIAGLRWGVYTGSADNSPYPYYQSATGQRRRLLAKIALQPLMFSFGSWFGDDEVEQVVRQYIANVTGGDPNVLSQLTAFRLEPWEGAACPDGSWGPDDQAGYRSWIDHLAAGIGSSRVALILQPDLPFSMCTSSPVPLELVSYATRRLSALPHTTVYVDAGARYWPMPFGAAVSMLERAGVRWARGFALDSSEYDATGAEIEYGARLARALAAAGIGGKHFVVNTAENGAPFLNGQVSHPQVCHRRGEQMCVTLGIPPTTHVASPRWRLSPLDRGLAGQYVDGYVWAGRPWLDNGTGPFDVPLALAMAASSPW